MQRTLMQYYKKENQREVIQALIAAHREDLIGNRPDCLVQPDAQYLRQQREKREKMSSQQNQRGPVRGRQQPAKHQHDTHGSRHKAKAPNRRGK